MISLFLALQVVGSLISLGWGSDPNRDADLHDHFGIPVRQPASPASVAVNLIIVLIVCWALYAGYRFARWTLVLLYAGVSTVLAWVFSRTVCRPSRPIVGPRYSSSMSPLSSSSCWGSFPLQLPPSNAGNEQFHRIRRGPPPNKRLKPTGHSSPLSAVLPLGNETRRFQPAGHRAGRIGASRQATASR
jgi:hypothetical protein